MKEVRLKHKPKLAGFAAPEIAHSATITRRIEKATALPIIQGQTKL
jgi:hypothetical protein